LVEHPKVLREDTDHLASNAACIDSLPQDLAIPANFSLPIAVAEETLIRSARDVILLREGSSQRGLDAKNRQQARCDGESRDTFWFSAAGNSFGASLPKTNVDECCILFAVS
jgi:hypothetical protein